MVSETNWEKLIAGPFIEKLRIDGVEASIEDELLAYLRESGLVERIRAEAFEEACKAICDGCAKGWPVAKQQPDWPLEHFDWGPMCDCKAAPIRELAAKAKLLVKGEKMADTYWEERAKHAEAVVAAIVGWLEKNQRDVFRRGLWDVIPVKPKVPESATPAPMCPREDCPVHLVSTRKPTAEEKAYGESLAPPAESATLPTEVEERFIGTSKEMERALELDQAKLDALMGPAESAKGPAPTGRREGEKS